MIQAIDLCNYARNAISGGYCYGSSGEVCSLARRQQWAVANPAQQANLLGVCAKWDGKKVWDCSGLFRGAWRALAIYKSGGATTIFNTWCIQSGLILQIPDEPGIAVFRSDGKGMAHVGLYLGDGMVVDARGASKGVLHGPLKEYAWTHWGRLAEVSYLGVNAVEEKIKADMSEKRTPLYLAIVIDVKTGLNFRTSPGNGLNTMELLKPGSVVEVLQEHCGNGFSLVRVNRREGYVTEAYLMPLGCDK